jgi:hypothetical protein
MLERKKERFVPPYNLALAFAGLGQTETALHWLDQAFDNRDVHMTFLLDRKWDGMRRNAYFKGIVERSTRRPPFNVQTQPTQRVGINPLSLFLPLFGKKVECCAGRRGATGLNRPQLR